jgi:methylthioxylose transferase
VRGVSRPDVRHPERERGTGRRAWPAVAAVGLLVLGTGLVGRALTARGADLHLLGGVVLRGGFAVTLTPQLVLPIAFAAAGVLWGPGLASRVSWRRLLVGSWLAAIVWAVSLALVRHWGRLHQPLDSRYEYPHDVDRVGAIGDFLAGFTASVPADAAEPWTTHVAGHPPGALLAFVLMDRLGVGALAGGTALSIAAGAAAVPAVLITVRGVADEAAARVVAPFAVLAPTALMVATSADALFAGVAAWGTAGLATAAVRTPGPAADLRALAGGLLLGLALFLSFGLTALGLVALAVVLVHRDRLGWAGGARVLAVGGLGVVAVVAVFAVGGYWWFDGLSAAADRVRSGPSYADRPLGFFLVANLAAAALMAGPAAVAGLACARRVRLAAVPLAALAGMLISNLTGLVRGEAERIWLPFTVWLLVATAFLPARSRRGWLIASAAIAVLIEVFVRTEW